MNADELIRKLSRMYEHAPKGEVNAMLVSFGGSCTPKKYKTAKFQSTALQNGQSAERGRTSVRE